MYKFYVYVSIIANSCKYKLYEVVVSLVVCTSYMYYLFVLVIRTSRMY